MFTLIIKDIHQGKIIHRQELDTVFHAVGFCNSGLADKDLSDYEVTGVMYLPNLREIQVNVVCR